jgi:hypothetical protein
MVGTRCFVRSAARPSCSACFIRFEIRRWGSSIAIAHPGCPVSISEQICVFDARSCAIRRYPLPAPGLRERWSVGRKPGVDPGIHVLAEVPAASKQSWTAGSRPAEKIGGVSASAFATDFWNLIAAVAHRQQRRDPGASTLDHCTRAILRELTTGSSPCLPRGALRTRRSELRMRLRQFSRCRAEPKHAAVRGLAQFAPRRSVRFGAYAAKIEIMEPQLIAWLSSNPTHWWRLSKRLG